jgi:uncharacterized protein (UPF0335 family)
MTDGATADLLRSFVQRIERLKEEQDAIADDVREVYAEAKAMGFDKTALGQVVAIRRKRAKDAQKFEELSAIVDLYTAMIEGRAPADDEPSRPRTRMHVRRETVDPVTGEVLGASETREPAPAGEASAEAPAGTAGQNTAPGYDPQRPVADGLGKDGPAARPAGDSGNGIPGQAGSVSGEAGGASNGVPAPAPQRTLAEIAGDYQPTKPPPADTEEPDIPAFLLRGHPECPVKETRP